MIQALFDSKLLMFFIMTMGIIVTILLAIFITQNFTILSGIKEQLIPIVNQTNLNVNQTQLFLEQTKHDDERQDKVNQMEMQGRSNQTKVILNNTQELLTQHHNGLINMNTDLKKFIGVQNNTTLKLFQKIRDAQEQNKEIMKVLINTTDSLNELQESIQKNSSNTNIQVSKWGPENNVLGKAIVEKLGENATEILQRDLYSNQTLKEMISPSSPP